MKHSAAIIVILVISALFGVAFEGVMTHFEKSSHPLMYAEYVDKYAGQYAIPREIVYAVMKTESGFRSDVVSSANAIGLMQITQDTFDWLKSKTGEDIDMRLLYDPEVNIRYGVCLLNLLYLEFGDWDLTFAAYNAGRGRVKNEWMTNPSYIKDGKIVHIPYPETRAYIAKVDKNAAVYKRLYFEKG